MSELSLAVLLGLGLLLVAALLLAPRWRRRRRLRLAAQPFPSAWRRILRRRLPLLARLAADQQLRLKGLIQVFLAEKPIIGCAGLQVTDEMRVLIAAQACLPLLGHARGMYPRLRQVLLYPGAFFVNRPVNAPGGVLRDERRALAGESWGEGQVILSWADVLRGAAIADDGQNVVIHEFAHQLDQDKGQANGAPLLADAAAQQRWSRVMQAEFDALRERLAEGEPGLLGAYAASEPAEFFACASEVFFEQGAQLAALHPALYRELAGFYRLDSAAW